jgi:hypothetical protein
MHCIHRLRLGKGWLCHLLGITLNMGVLCMLVRMLHRNGSQIWLSEPFYGEFISRFDYDQVVWAFCWPNMLRLSFCRYKVFLVRDPCYLFSLFRFALTARKRNLVVPAHRSLAISQPLYLAAKRGIRCLMTCRFCLRGLHLFPR